MTEAQKNASRLNGKKSGGPKTAAGKFRSSLNATRHGILASAIVLEGEDPIRFRNLVRDFTLEFQPLGPVQEALVETMAVSRWRQMRIWSMEKQALDWEIRNCSDPAGDSSPAGRASQAFRSLSDHSRYLDLLIRYETRYDRQFARALARFLEISKRTRQVVDSTDKELL